MNKQTAIVLSIQNVNLEEILPPGGETVLAPRCHIDNVRGDLLNFLNEYMGLVEKTPHFIPHDPVYVIINSSPQGLLAAIYIYGYFSFISTTVHLWVLRNEEDGEGKYLSLEQARMEGYEKHRSYYELQKVILAESQAPLPLELPPQQSHH
jgi:hypothetical protein